MVNSMLLTRKLVILILSVLLSACASTGERVAQMASMSHETIVIASITHSPSSGSIYGGANTISLYDDKKASRVGDIVTIILAEETNASKSASTSTVKENNLDVLNPTLLGSAFSLRLPGFMPLGGTNRSLESTLSSTKTFSGEGDSEQSNKMSGTVTALVTKVLENGNLVINGKKRITINNGDEYIHITGIIRPRDISGNNMVFSNKIANAEISYSGTGVISAVNQTGWLTKFFNSKWWPF